MSRPVKSDQPILIIEDSPEEYEATVRTFRKAGVANPIFHCQTGEEALDFLLRRGAFGDPRAAPRPGIILLDLNLPGTDGRETLREIKRAEGLRSIPVIVLTTSADDRDVDACYRDGANSYVQKPVDLGGFARALRVLRDYWLETALLPHRGGDRP
jgi:CheY-like chemotaxis protein